MRFLDLGSTTRTSAIAHVGGEPTDLRALASNGGITKTGAGTLLLGASNSVCWWTDSECRRAVALRNNGAGGTGRLTLNSGNGALTKAGPGEVTLSGLLNLPELNEVLVRSNVGPGLAS